MNNPYTTSFDILQYGDANVELVYENTFPNKRDLECMEGQYINSTPNAVHKKGAGMTTVESSRKCYLKHRDTRLERKTRDLCGGAYTRANRWHHNKTKTHQAALENQEQFHSASSTQTPEGSDSKISSESSPAGDEARLTVGGRTSFYLSVASSG